MKYIDSFFEKYANQNLCKACQNYCVKDDKNVFLSKSTKIRSQFRFNEMERKAIASFFIPRVLISKLECHDNFSSTGKRVSEAVEIIAKYEGDKTQFLEQLNLFLESWQGAVMQDCISYSLSLLGHPIVNGNSTLRSIAILLRDQATEDEENDCIDEELCQLIAQYKKIKKEDVEDIVGGIQAFLNDHFVEDVIQPGRNFIGDSASLVHKELPWLILQLIPVAVFISINLAKNERPSAKTYGRTKNYEKRFEKIGRYLRSAQMRCFDNLAVDEYNDVISTVEQDRFIEFELKEPSKKILVMRKPRKNIESSECKRVTWSDGLYIAPYHENPYEDFRPDQLDAYVIFKKLVACCSVRYTTATRDICLKSDRALNWMVFEQLTGLLSAADYGFIDPINPELDVLQTIRGSHMASVLRNMEMDWEPFLSQKFLGPHFGNYLKSSFPFFQALKATAGLFSSVPLAARPEDNSGDYIDWIKKAEALKQRRDRYRRMIFEEEQL